MIRPKRGKKEPSGDEFDRVVGEVNAKIREHADDWLKLQNRIRDRFHEYQEVGELRSAIYNVYTRADRQPKGVQNPHLKSAAKIAEEICLQRRGGTKSRTGQKREIPAKPKFNIYEVSDIIGVTIVCPFDSDVERVVQQIEKDCAGNTFTKIDQIKRHNRKDYQAVHLALRIPEGRFRILQCEVQIKTAVQDAFAWKTHALAYKPEDNADPWFVDQFARISEILRTADSFSDQLRDRLEKERSISQVKRRSVRTDLLLLLREIIAGRGDGPKRKELQAIAKELDEYIGGPRDKQTGAALRPIEEQIESVLKQYGCDSDTLRLAALCATAPGSDGFIHVVRRNYEDWIREEPKGKHGALDRIEEQARFANIITIAYFCLNDVRSAIQFAEQAVERGRTLKSGELGQLHVNLAYYYAESFGETRDREHARLAESHAAQARNIFGAKLAGPDRDSLGYVRIATGASIQDIEQGLAECKAAFEENKKAYKADKPLLQLATKFFEMHRELAYKRLSQLVSKVNAVG